MANPQKDEPILNGLGVIIRALHAVMEEVDSVQKSGENTFHDYRYATEGDLLRKLRAPMLRNGLVLIPSVDQVAAVDAHGNTTVSVIYTLTHTSGAIWPEKIKAAGCGGDKSKKGVGDKGLYKALTGANKYMLLKLFQIETGDDEDEPENSKGDEGRDSVSEDAAARAFYLEGAKIAVSKAETAADLRRWWDDEYDNRRKAGVTKGTEEYSDLYERLLRRGDELKKKEAR